MKIIDITQELFSCRTYPGDRPPAYERVKHIERDGYNLTDISLCVHNGTHIDAPSHFIPGGKAVDALDLSVFYGECTVAERSGVLGEDEMEQILKGCGERLLLKGDCELSDSGAAAVARSHVRLIGVESQSVGSMAHPMSVHVTLLQSEVVLLEGLDLSTVRPGAYILSAFPLNLRGADGAPVRAVLLDRP